MKKVLEVLPAFSTGGVEKYVFDVLSRLSSKYKKHPFYVASAGGGLVRSLPKNVTHFQLPLDQKSKIIQNAFSLVKLCKEHKIGRIHVHSRAPAWSCYLASLVLKIPYASTYHGAHKAQNKFKKFYNSGMLRGEYVIAVSRFIHEHLKIYENTFKIIDIFEGIDPYQFEPISVPEGILKRQELQIPFYQKVILVPGRFTRIKGQKDFVHAVSKLANLDTITLMFIGNHQENKSYAKEIKDLCDGYKLTYLMLDPVEDLVPYYALADLVVVPTLVPESFGRVIAEALSMNKLVVSFAHGGALELSNQGKLALLAKPLDFDDLASKMNVALNSQEALEHYKGRDFIAQNYSLSRMVKGIEEKVYL